MDAAARAPASVFRAGGTEDKSSDVERASYTRALQHAQQRMGSLFTATQILGRTKTIGSTAVEITQRCNLDCTLCYLSEHSEAVRDLPLEEVFRRLEAIKAEYGVGTNVQITGGDPTLSKKHELIAIVRHARSLGLMPALFTNGIAARRKLLVELVGAGLSDVAFHVDTTQQRKGYDSESDLNAVRKEYIERVRGLPLMVVFNTTVHDGNLTEVPGLVRFFAAHADVVDLASFQLQAETGRGSWGKSTEGVSLESVRRCIGTVSRAPLPWDAVRVGHPKCHSYAAALVANGQLHPLLSAKAPIAEFLRDFAGIPLDRRRGNAWLVWRHLCAALRRPVWYWRGLRHGAELVWRMRGDLWRGFGRVHRLSLFVQNFMNAKELDEERIEACSFMVMTAEGPVSMCAHNARRDEYILKPIHVTGRDGRRIVFEPLGTRRRANRPT